MSEILAVFEQLTLTALNDLLEGYEARFIWPFAMAGAPSEFVEFHVYRQHQPCDESR